MSKLGEALKNAERIRIELPQLIQPERTCYHMIELADEIYRLRKVGRVFNKRPSAYSLGDLRK